MPATYFPTATKHSQRPEKKCCFKVSLSRQHKLVYHRWLCQEKKKKQTSKQVLTTPPLFMLRDESLFQFFTAAGKDNEERKGNVIRDIAV